MPYSAHRRALASLSLLLLGSTLAGACGSSSSSGAGTGEGGIGGETGVGSSCERNSNCPGALLCDRFVHQCVECLSDDDCADGVACVAGACERGCSSDRDCRPTGQLCSEASVCVDCLDDTDCADGETCSVDGSCQAPDTGSGGASASSSGGAMSNDAGAPPDPAGGSSSAGGTLSGAAGMPNVGGGDNTALGPGCTTIPIDPCSGLPHFVGTQIVDGDPSEFCDIPPFTLALSSSPYYRTPQAPTTAGTKATFRVAWSATALHAYVEVVDPAVHPNLTGSTLNIWNGDNVELFASPKPPAGLFTASRSYESGAFQIIVAPPNPGGTPTTPSGLTVYASTGVTAAVPAAQYKTFATQTGYGFEVQIPWTDAAPIAGMGMGFDAGLSDDIDGLLNAKSEYRDYYALLYNASYAGTNCTTYYEPYCDSRNWCVPIALP